MKLQSELHFDKERHHYTWRQTFEGENGTVTGPPPMDLLGVSSFLHGYAAEFDEEFWAKHCAKRDGRQVGDVKREWARKRDRACALGHYVHDRCEETMLNARKDGYFRITPDSSPHAGYVRAFQHFLVEFGKHFNCKTLMPELQLCWPEVRLAGTIDLLCQVNGKWCIIDFKSNEEIKFDAYKGATMEAPFDQVADVNFGHYTCQLSSYGVMAREALGIEVEHLRLLHLTPSGAFKVHEVPFIEDAVYNALSDESRILRAIQKRGEEHATE